MTTGNETPPRTPPVDVIEVRFALPATWRAELPSLAELLDSGERARAESFRAETARTSYVAAHGLLRQWLAEVTGLPAKTLAFAAPHGGKPTLVDRPEVHFSVTHTDGLVAVAMACNRAVGVDAEHIRAETVTSDVLAVALSAAERDAVEALPAAERVTAFYRGWTRKEAFLKGIGEGLSRPPGDVAVGDLTRALEAPHAPMTSGAGAARWRVRDLEAPPGFAAALAWEESGSSPRIIVLLGG